LNTESISSLSTTGDVMQESESVTMLATGGVIIDTNGQLRSDSPPHDEMRAAARMLWDRIVEQIKQQVTQQSFTTWFEPLEPVSLEGVCLLLKAPSSFISEWVLQHYQTLIESLLAECLGPSAKFEFEHGGEADTPLPVETILAPSAKAPEPVNRFDPANVRVRANQPAPAPVEQLAPIASNLNANYTFDSFIRGESNNLAYAAAIAVANNPGGTRYNPLVVYGNVGLGKTHLVQAVGNHVSERYPDVRVYYTTSDRFTTEYIDAVQEKRINEFSNFYRSIELLIIDDVQFLAGKEKTQELFFHTFNELREKGKQIILTCDRPPKELKDIDDRLLNRLQWGLTTDIGAPELEMRLAILRQWAERDQVEIKEEVLEFLASNVTTNIRELEGCFISLLSKASLTGTTLSVDLARDVLRQVARRTLPQLTIETIQNSVAKYFAIEPRMLADKTRRQEIVVARHVAMFLCTELTQHSLKTIGMHFGGRDHSTVIHARETVIDELKHDKALENRVTDIRRQLELMQ